MARNSDNQAKLGRQAKLDKRLTGSETNQTGRGLPKNPDEIIPGGTNMPKDRQGPSQGRRKKAA
jgi:hypothetical protein